jgi:hypothetical protein
MVEGEGATAPTKVEETTVFPSGEPSVPVSTCLERTGSTDSHPQCNDPDNNGQVDKGEFSTNTAAFEMVVCWVIRVDPSFDDKREAVLNPGGDEKVSNSEIKAVVSDISSADTVPEISNLHAVAQTLIQPGTEVIVPVKSTGLFHEGDTQITVATCLERVGSTGSHSQCIDHNGNGFISRNEADFSTEAHQTVTAFVSQNDPNHVAKLMAITDKNNDSITSSHELLQIPAPPSVTTSILYSNSSVSPNLFCPIPYGGSYVSQATCNARAFGPTVVIPIDLPTGELEDGTKPDSDKEPQVEVNKTALPTVPVVPIPVSNVTNSETWHARWIQRAKGARTEWITKRALLDKVKEYK